MPVRKTSFGLNIQKHKTERWLGDCEGFSSCNIKARSAFNLQSCVIRFTLFFDELWVRTFLNCYALYVRAVTQPCALQGKSFTGCTTTRGGWRGSSSCTNFKTGLAPRSLSPTYPTTTKATQFSSITEEILRKWKQTFRLSPWYGTLKIVNHVYMLTILKLIFKIDFLSPFQPCLSLPKLFLFKSV